MLIGVSQRISWDIDSADAGTHPNLGGVWSIDSTAAGRFETSDAAEVAPWRTGCLELVTGPVCIEDKATANRALMILGDAMTGLWRIRNNGKTDDITDDRRSVNGWYVPQSLTVEEVHLKLQRYLVSSVVGSATVSAPNCAHSRTFFRAIRGDSGDDTPSTPDASDALALDAPKNSSRMLKSVHPRFAEKNLRMSVLSDYLKRTRDNTAANSSKRWSAPSCAVDGAFQVNFEMGCDRLADKELMQGLFGRVVAGVKEIHGTIFSQTGYNAAISIWNMLNNSPSLRGFHGGEKNDPRFGGWFVTLLWRRIVTEYYVRQYGEDNVDRLDKSITFKNFFAVMPRYDGVGLLRIIFEGSHQFNGDPEKFASFLEAVGRMLSNFSDFDSTIVPSATMLPGILRNFVADEDMVENILKNRGDFTLSKFAGFDVRPGDDISETFLRVLRTCLRSSLSFMRDNIVFKLVKIFRFMERNAGEDAEEYRKRREGAKKDAWNDMKQRERERFGFGPPTTTGKQKIWKRK